MRALLTACLASAFAFAIAFVAWMFLTVAMEGSREPPPVGVLRLSLFAFGAGFVCQVVYGGLIYVALTRLHAWNFWMLAFACLLPVVLFSWSASDTTQDILGTIPWLGFALIVAFVTWVFVPAD